MVKINKKTNKRAFTLVELVLAIAIIMLVSSVFVALVISIRDSYKRVYNSNDSTDYAALYSQAIENYSLKFCQGSYAVDKFYVYILDNANLVIDGGAKSEDHIYKSEPAQLKDTNNRNKWKICIDYDSIKYSDNIVSYDLVILDNYSYKKEYGANADVFQLRYSASFWVPHNKTLTIEKETNGPVLNYWFISDLKAAGKGAGAAAGGNKVQPGTIVINKSGAES